MFLGKPHTHQMPNFLWIKMLQPFLFAFMSWGMPCSFLPHSFYLKLYFISCTLPINRFLLILQVYAKSLADFYCQCYSKWTTDLWFLSCCPIDSPPEVPHRHVILNLIHSDLLILPAPASFSLILLHSALPLCSVSSQESSLIHFFLLPTPKNQPVQ